MDAAIVAPKYGDNAERRTPDINTPTCAWPCVENYSVRRPFDLSAFYQQ
jgi:hypothetical protein